MSIHFFADSLFLFFLSKPSDGSGAFLFVCFLLSSSDDGQSSLGDTQFPTPMLLGLMEGWLFNRSSTSFPNRSIFLLPNISSSCVKLHQPIRICTWPSKRELEIRSIRKFQLEHSLVLHFKTIKPRPCPTWLQILFRSHELALGYPILEHRSREIVYIYLILNGQSSSSILSLAVSRPPHDLCHCSFCTMDRAWQCHL